MKIYPLGDNAVILHIANEMSKQTLECVQQISDCLQQMKKDWIIEWTTAYTSITIYYDICKVHQYMQGGENVFDFIKRELKKVRKINERNSKRKIEIPVCYDECFALDIKEVAKRNNLSSEEVISIHSSGVYVVAMIGFSPGFPFLQGLNKKIVTPRKETPRLEVVAGSVGIAGIQTGIYPSQSPGGWQIIGRTPMKLFRSHHKEPSLLKAGDKVKFKPITKDEFYEMEKENK